MVGELLVTGEVIEEVGEDAGIVRGEVEAAVTGAGEVEAEEIRASEVEEIKGALQGIGALESDGGAGIDVVDHRDG